MSLQTILLWLHVTGNLFWMGSITAVAMVLRQSGAKELRRDLALALYRRLAVPAFLTSFVAGLAMIAMNASHFLVQSRWMHPKLTFALVVIVLHHVIGARAKRLASDEPVPAVTPLAGALVICAVAAAFFAVVKPF